jgi:hypothetical protein
MSDVQPSHEDEYVRPKFNVVESFDGVVMVQMNSTMSRMLQEFIGEFEDLEIELTALGRALRDPKGAYALRNEKREARKNPRRRYVQRE